MADVSVVCGLDLEDHTLVAGARDGMACRALRCPRSLHPLHCPCRIAALHQHECVSALRRNPDCGLMHERVRLQKCT